MNKHKKLIEQFYDAFNQNDWQNMHACYHPKIHFYDPVFQDLEGKQVLAMWHMLCDSATDLKVSHSHVHSSSATGRANWVADYTFSTGRPVKNVIEARFMFQDDLIVKHTDSFNLWKWAGMALGLNGHLLGWSPIVQGRIRSSAKSRLKKFIAEHPEYH